MKKRKVRNRLLELIQERERKRGRRIILRDIAEFVDVSDHTITNWIRNNVTRFDSKLIEGLCDYFDCDVSDLLYFEWIETGQSSEEVNE
ncbi:MAG: helix-turn-helix transcriptional regulator [Anaerolineae bacterium]|nr:helix-turn-helix transcriptional regulator [Anaerolineae bacterium]MDQ7036308.1 helix-turn-helix transcriptional regulator [Anaerolineae bacterium]